MNLELYSAKNIMARPPTVVRARENVARLSELLLSTFHGGYPVVKNSSKDRKDEVFFGFINRLQLTVILKYVDAFRAVDDFTPSPIINYLAVGLICW